jgi:hypothetical protein
LEVEETEDENDGGENNNYNDTDNLRKEDIILGQYHLQDLR